MPLLGYFCVEGLAVLVQLRDVAVDVIINLRAQMGASASFALATAASSQQE